jgi:hypothetical protein
MHIGSEACSIGRFVVDIDNSLRTTDQPCLTAREIIAMYGRRDDTASVIWETNGRSILLSPSDRIEMDENRVDFFRIVERSYCHGSMGRPLGAYPFALAA